jgi:hypothetical protein
LPFHPFTRKLQETGTVGIGERRKNMEIRAMMKKQRAFPGGFILAAMLLLAAGISACSFTIDRYGVSASNVETMKQLQIKPVAIDTFESLPPGLYSLGGCRLRNSIQTPYGLSFALYLEQAFSDELRLAGFYDPSSKTRLRGRLEKITFDSSVPTGNWIMMFRIASNADPGYSIESKYEFSTNMVAAKACQQVAEAFRGAVQQLILRTISDPRFKELLQN